MIDASTLPLLAAIGSPTFSLPPEAAFLPHNALLAAAKVFAHGLEHLSMSLSRTTDAVLQALCASAAHATLQSLDLSSCDYITDDGLLPLSACTALQTLNLSNCNYITNESSNVLCAACPGLQKLSVAHNSQLTAKWLHNIIKYQEESGPEASSTIGLPNLTALDLRATSLLADAIDMFTLCAGMEAFTEFRISLESDQKQACRLTKERSLLKFPTYLSPATLAQLPLSRQGRTKERRADFVPCRLHETQIRLKEPLSVKLFRVLRDVVDPATVQTVRLMKESRRIPTEVLRQQWQWLSELPQLREVYMKDRKHGMGVGALETPILQGYLPKLDVSASPKFHYLRKLSLQIACRLDLATLGLFAQFGRLEEIALCNVKFIDCAATTSGSPNECLMRAFRGCPYLRHFTLSNYLFPCKVKWALEHPLLNTLVLEARYDSTPTIVKKLRLPELESFSVAATRVSASVLKTYGVKIIAFNQFAENKHLHAMAALRSFESRCHATSFRLLSPTVTSLHLFQSLVKTNSLQRLVNRLPRLHSLEVVCCPNVTSIQALRSDTLANLTIRLLHLKAEGAFTLDNTPNVRQLSLSDCTGITAITLMDKAGLTSIKLQGMRGLQSLSISNNNWLFSFNAHDLPELKSMSLQAGRLRELGLSRAQLLDRFDLFDCPRLARLELNDLRKFEAFDQLRHIAACCPETWSSVRRFVKRMRSAPA